MPLPPDTSTSLDGCRALYLQQLGALLGNMGQLSAPAIASVQQGAGRQFDEIAASRQRGSFKEEAKGLTSSRITLVGDDELELDIRLDNLSKRLLEASGDKLWKVHRRFATLLRRPEMPRSDNPVGPDGIARGLREMLAAAGIPLDKKLALLEALEDMLLERLPALYAALDDFLEQAGIDPAQPAILTRPDSARPAAAAEAARPADIDPLYALHRSLLARTAGQPTGGAFPAPKIVPLGQAAREQLKFRLDELSRQPATAAPREAGAAPTLEALIPGLFDNGGQRTPAAPAGLDTDQLGVPPHSSEGLAIDTLAAICDAMMADPSLPDALKGVIGSLRITFLKCALADPDFFTNDRHPARQLLDAMALAMRGLPLDTPPTHPSCARLAAIAERWRLHHDAERAGIAAARGDVEALITERNTAIGHAAAPYIPLLHQLERRDHASQQARLTLGRLGRQGLPAPIRGFLDNTWNRVLQLIWLEYGPGSTQWQVHVKAVEDLLWTFLPKNSLDERKDLARRLPEVLNLLKAGMERIGVAASEQGAFLDTCFALQTRAMRSTPDSPEKPDPQTIDAGPLPRPRATAVAGEIQSGNLVLRTLDFTDRQPAPPRALPCETGDWLEIAVDDSTRRIARLCYLSPSSQRALFHNPEIDLALAIHPALLDQQLRSNRARVLGSPQIFDNAIGRALKA